MQGPGPESDHGARFEAASRGCVPAIDFFCSPEPMAPGAP
jgi:hypothetical protein